MPLQSVGVGETEAATVERTQSAAAVLADEVQLLVAASLRPVRAQRAPVRPRPLLRRRRLLRRRHKRTPSSTRRPPVFTSAPISTERGEPIDGC